MPYIFESLWLIPSRSCLCFKDFNSQGIFNTVEVTLFLTPPYHQHSSPCAFFMLFVPVTWRSWSAAAAVQLHAQFPSAHSHRQLTLRGSLREDRLPVLLRLLLCICSVAAHCSQLHCVSRN